MPATDRSRRRPSGDASRRQVDASRRQVDASWRSGDLRGDEGAPRSVDSVVRATWWGIVVGRQGECVLIGATALLLVLAAGNLGGATLGRWDLWCVAGVSALLAGAGWSLEHRVRPVDVARALDERLRHQGALFTAWELETEDARSPGPMGSLLVGQVLTRLRRGEAMRALFPSLVVPVAAPLVAAAALAAALERTRPPERPSIVLGVTGEIVAELDRLRTGTIEEEGPYLETAKKLRAVSSAARDLDRRLPELMERDPAQALETLEKIDRDLAELAPSVPPTEELRSSLSAARSWVDSARQALLEEASLDHAQAEEGPPAPAEGPETGSQPGPNAEGTTPGVTESGGDGTMVGSPSGETASGAPPEGAAEPAPGVPERGSAAGVWWPAAYDDVVRRWSDARSTPSSDD